MTVFSTGLLTRIVGVNFGCSGTPGVWLEQANLGTESVAQNYMVRLHQNNYIYFWSGAGGSDTIYRYHVKTHAIDILATGIASPDMPTPMSRQESNFSDLQAPYSTSIYTPRITFDGLYPNGDSKFRADLDEYSYTSFSKSYITLGGDWRFRRIASIRDNQETTVYELMGWDYSYSTGPELDATPHSTITVWGDYAFTINLDPTVISALYTGQAIDGETYIPANTAYSRVAGAGPYLCIFYLDVLGVSTFTMKGYRIRIKSELDELSIVYSNASGGQPAYWEPNLSVYRIANNTTWTLTVEPGGATVDINGTSYSMTEAITVMAPLQGVGALTPQFTLQPGFWQGSWIEGDTVEFSIKGLGDIVAIPATGTFTTTYDTVFGYANWPNIPVCVGSSGDRIGLLSYQVADAAFPGLDWHGDWFTYSTTLNQWVGGVFADMTFHEELQNNTGGFVFGGLTNGGGCFYLGASKVNGDVSSPTYTNPIYKQKPVTDFGA